MSIAMRTDTFIASDTDIEAPRGMPSTVHSCQQKDSSLKYDFEVCVITL